MISLISGEIASKRGRITIKYLKGRISDTLDVSLSSYKIKKILTTELKLAWKKVKKHQPYVNSPNNLILRRMYAAKIIDCLREKKIVINFDETQISSSCERTYSWASKS